MCSRLFCRLLRIKFNRVSWLLLGFSELFEIMNGYAVENDPEENVESGPEFYDPVAIFLSSVNYSTENLTDELK